MHKLIIVLLIIAGCGNNKVVIEELTEDVNEEMNEAELVFEAPPELPPEFETMFKTVEAKVIKEPFVNQGGREIAGAFDFFLNFEDKNWFVKFSAGKVLRTDLEKLVGQTGTFRISIQEGLWDTDDPMIQSRIGKYVAVHEIIE